ncbi:MAG: peptide deformylase [Clostridiales bacterium]|jgi:peptide deformylase|nr:peptide deformylase [Clostridiales bacterium]
MALRKILTVSADEKRLRCVSKPVAEFNSKLFDLIDDLHDTLKKADGLGLAAPQVGILKRVAIVIDADSGKSYELINPVIIGQEGEAYADEGCLSIPKYFVKTKRPAKVTVRTHLRNGTVTEYTGEGMLARAFCHELDHLDGKLFTDINGGQPEKK